MKNVFSRKKPIANIDVNLHSSHKNRMQYGEETEKDKKNIFTGIFDKLVSISLFMIFLGVPLFFTGLAFQGIVFEKQIYFYFWILLALVAWVSSGVISGELKIRKTPLDIPIISFLVIYSVATFFSVDRWHSFWGFFGDPSMGLVNLLAIIIAYYLIISNYSTKKMYWMIGGLIISNLIIAVWSVLIFFGVKVYPESISSYIPISIIGSIAGLKIFAGMMIPILMAVVFKISGYKNKKSTIVGYLLLILVPINLTLILIFYQKIIALIVLFGVGFFLLYILANIIRSEKKMIWVPMVTFILATIILIIGNNNLTKVAPLVEISPSAKISWDVAKNSLKDNLVIGSGPASYGFSFLKYKPIEFNDNIFYDAKFYRGAGLFFESLATIGILGTVVFLVLLITFINVAIYLISKDKEKDKIYSLGLLSAVMIIISGLIFLKLEGTILILGGILSALVMATMLHENNVEGKYIRLSLKASPKFALTLAFIFIIVSAGVATLFVYIGKAYVADIYAGKSVRMGNASDESAVNNILRAISLNKKEGRYYSRAGQEYMLLANNEATKSSGKKDIQKIKTYLGRASLYAKKATQYMHNDSLSISALAQVNESLAMYTPETLSSALKNYEELAVLNPNSPTPYLKVGQIKLAMAATEKDKDKRKKFLEEANDDFQKSIDKKKDFAEGYFYLSLVKNALEDKDGAINSIIEAIRIDQNNIAYLFNLGGLYQNRNKKGDLDSAQKIFEYIIIINPKNIDVNFSLALLYEKRGEKENAITQYNKTIKLISESDDNGSRDEIINQIKKMIENVNSGINNNDVVMNNMEEAKTNNLNKQNDKNVINSDQQNSSIAPNVDIMQPEASKKDEINQSTETEI